MKKGIEVDSRVFYFISFCKGNRILKTISKNSMFSSRALDVQSQGSWVGAWPSSVISCTLYYLSVLIALLPYIVLQYHVFESKERAFLC